MRVALTRQACRHAPQDVELCCACAGQHVLLPTTRTLAGKAMVQVMMECVWGRGAVRPQRPAAPQCQWSGAQTQQPTLGRAAPPPALSSPGAQQALHLCAYVQGGGTQARGGSSQGEARVCVHVCVRACGKKGACGGGGAGNFKELDPRTGSGSGVVVWVTAALAR